MQPNEMKPQFIGQAALEQVATKIEPEIVMGPAFSRAGYFERMGFKVISGIQFKSIAYVMNRKGLTTVRKVVGKEVNSTIGYLEERPMVCKLTWNHFTDNKSSYQENPVINPEGGNFTYPASELAMKAVLANYGEDLLNALWHGDDTLDADNELGLYTGYITYLRRDIEKGRVSIANGNLITCETIEKPSSTTDIGALDAFDNWYNKWNPKLQNQEKVLVYGRKEVLYAIADAYANSRNQNKEANFLANGNFVIPRYSNIEFCPDALMGGSGDLLIATIPDNFQYGVDTENADTFVGVKVGTDRDMGEIQFQVQSVQGTRVLNVNSSVFAMSDGSLTYRSLSGDYQKDTFVVLSSDTTLGTVTVNGAAADNTKEWASGVTLTLVATATGGEFVKWSNGATATTISVVTKGQPEAITAIFKAADESDASGASESN